MWQFSIFMPDAVMTQLRKMPRVAVTGYAAYLRRVDRQRFFLDCSQNDALRDWWQAPVKPPLDGMFPASFTIINRKIQEMLFGAGSVDLAQYSCPEERSVVFSTSKMILPRTGEETFNPVLDSGSLAGRFAATIEATGPTFSPVAACATGAHCIAIGAQRIAWDYSKLAVAGACEPPQRSIALAGYRQLGALSKSGVMRPFDKRRDGFVPSEGTGALILENEENARARGAKIYGYVTGYDMGADATSLTGMCPSGDSIARAIERALQRAGNPRIDYINAHGTATHLNDEIESRGIKSVFGDRVPVSSTKPLTGHLLGAAGAVEAAICLQALREKWAPPTLNLEEADPACDLDYIPVIEGNIGRDLPLKTVMSLNYGFGGHIGVLIFEAA
jgi:3-oxoacyl-[acyl-carrier-protein] synthase II